MSGIPGMVRRYRSGQPQQCSRLPALDGRQIRPGDWLVVGAAENWHRKARVAQVRSLAGMLTTRDQAAVRWMLHFTDGTSCEWHAAVRWATEAEVLGAERRQGR